MGRGDIDVDVQVRLLDVIAHMARARAPVTVAGVAAEMGVTKPTAARWLGSLAAVPGIEGSPDPEHSQRTLWTIDRRAVRKHLGLEHVATLGDAEVRWAVRWSYCPNSTTSSYQAPRVSRLVEVLWYRFWG